MCSVSQWAGRLTINGTIFQICREMTPGEKLGIGLGVGLACLPILIFALINAFPHAMVVWNFLTCKPPAHDPHRCTNDV
jgi:hypothetical protein